MADVNEDEDQDDVEADHSVDKNHTINSVDMWVYLNNNIFLLHGFHFSTSKLKINILYINLLTWYCYMHGTAAHAPMDAGTNIHA